MDRRVALSPPADPIVVGDPNDDQIRSPRWEPPDRFDHSKSTEGNDWYNSRRILLDYCGIAGNPALPGRYQHGWQWGSGVDGETSATVGVYLQYKWPIWVWNNRNRTKAQHQGMHAKAIGAPALYLSPAMPAPDPAPNSLLAIPFHSNPPYIIRSGWAEYGSALADLGRGFNATTVLLHYRDYAGAGPVFAKLGMRPVTLGRPNGPRFLERLQYLIQSHSLVTGEHVCTAAFYTNLWGRPYLIHGPALNAPHDGDGSPDPFAGPGGDRIFVARQFPAFLRGDIDQDATAYELGADQKRSPAELLALMGWQS